MRGAGKNNSQSTELIDKTAELSRIWIQIYTYTVDLPENIMHTCVCMCVYIYVRI